MQELLTFWTECGLITGQRTPPSPVVLMRRDSCVEKASRADCIESGENHCQSYSVSSSPTTAQDKKSFKLQERFLSSPFHKSETEMMPSDLQNKWYGCLWSNTKTVKASCQTSRSNSRRKSSQAIYKDWLVSNPKYLGWAASVQGKNKKIKNTK